jgi:hypothetical protein
MHPIMFKKLKVNMKTIFKIQLTVLTVLLLSAYSFGQTTSIIAQPGNSNVVKLRWASESAAVWQTGNTNGYYIKREKMSGSTVTETTWLNGGNVIQPLALGTNVSNSPWAPFMANTIVNKDTIYTFPYHMAMIGAIYGDSVTLGDKITKIQASKTSDSTVVLKNVDSMKIAQRHFMALIAAEMDFDAARAGGLGFIDNSVQSSGTYRYSLYSSTVTHSAPSSVPDGCSSITLNTVYSLTENKTTICYDITLDEGFEADPGTNFEFVIEALDNSSSGSTTTTPASVGTSVLAISANTVVNGTQSLPTIAIQGKFPASKANIIQWLVPKNTPFAKYDIYRSSSANNLGYKKINKQPVVQLNVSSATASDTLYYTDIDSNLVVFDTYSYKVKAYTIFNDESTFSNEVSGKAIDAITVLPRINDYAINDSTSTTNATVNIKFELTAGIDTLLNSVKNQIILRYEIQKSIYSDSLFSTVGTNSDKTTKNLSYTMPLTEVEAVYLRVKVVYVGTKAPSYSSSVMIQLADRSPPAVASSISLDTNYPKIENEKAVIKIKWAVNTESDFLGYRIFRKNFAKEMEMNITNDIVSKAQLSAAPNNADKDTILSANASKLYTPKAVGGFVYLEDILDSKTLNDSIYYQIMSVDKRFNQSKLSAPFGVARPNMAPPVIPVFIKDSINHALGGVFLEFSISKDPDITVLELYRTTAANLTITNLTPIVTFNKNDFQLTDTLKYSLSYLDTGIKAGGTYVYLIRVVDRYLLNQDFISDKPLIVEVPVTVNTSGKEVDILSFTSTIVREPDWIELKWVHTSTAVREYQIYRGVYKGVFTPTAAVPTIPIKSWKELSSDYSSYKDKDVVVGSSYRYLIRAIYNNGAFSPWKEIVKIDF